MASAGTGIGQPVRTWASHPVPMGPVTPRPCSLTATLTPGPGSQGRRDSPGEPPPPRPGRAGCGGGAVARGSNWDSGLLQPCLADTAGLRAAGEPPSLRVRVLDNWEAGRDGCAQGRNRRLGVGFVRRVRCRDSSFTGKPWNSEASAPESEVGCTNAVWRASNGLLARAEETRQDACHEIPAVIRP